MNDAEWILLDTETTGFSAPIFVVELGAQRMQGWEPIGAPFRKLLNQNQDIPPAASRVHGYTREVLERDGESALSVYRDFLIYAGNRPLVAYNLEYDLEKVLLPEWERLDIPPIGERGFCALRLAQRLLDPVPAGNCKLQTLRQYYRLPERGAHTALGDVETVADLMSSVLKPLAESRGLKTWEAVCDFSNSIWYPSRLAFGKFKGRDFMDAKTDPNMQGWLEWLSESSNESSARMGRWYLSQLGKEGPAPAPRTAWVQAGEESETVSSASCESSLVVFVNPELSMLRQMVASARTRLAEMESDYIKQRLAVDAMQSALFKRVGRRYQSRDQLRLLIDYRKKYLSILLTDGEEEAEELNAEFQASKDQTENDYEEAAKQAENAHELSEDEERELNTLAKKLVRLYHPDRFQDQPDKLETYTRLTSVINKAREAGDIELLRAIANDPQGFILRQGWTELEFEDAVEIKGLQKLLDSLQIQIVTIIESLSALKDSSEYAFYQMCIRDKDFLKATADGLIADLNKEIEDLEVEANQLGEEIINLTQS